jgi:hypothetical protein
MACSISVGQFTLQPHRGCEVRAVNTRLALVPATGRTGDDPDPHVLDELAHFDTKRQGLIPVGDVVAQSLAGKIVPDDRLFVKLVPAALVVLIAGLIKRSTRKA